MLGNGSSVRAAFVMEQHLGHRSYYLGLRQFIDCSDLVEPNWVEVTYRPGNGLSGLLQRSPILGGTLAGMQQARQGLRSQDYQAAFFNTQVPAVLAGPLARRQPAAVATDVTPIQYDGMGRYFNHRPGHPLLRRWKHGLNRRMFRSAARLLPWSSWARRSLIEDYGADPARIEVLHPGVDLQRWSPGKRAHSGPVRILFVGGDFFRKGGPDLLQAFLRLPPGAAELILVTRSDVPAPTGVRVVRDLLPNTVELIDCYRSSDIFVLPSHAEPFGIAAVEACAAGLPVIAARSGGLVDIVEDGQNGFLVPPGDPAALSDRLRFLMDSPRLRHQLGDAGRARAESRFDASRSAGRVAQILHEISR